MKTIGGKASKIMEERLHEIENKTSKYVPEQDDYSSSSDEVADTVQL